MRFVFMSGHILWLRIDLCVNCGYYYLVAKEWTCSTLHHKLLEQSEVKEDHGFDFKKAILHKILILNKYILNAQKRSIYLQAKITSF
jgi:hypothetical protein